MTMADVQRLMQHWQRYPPLRDLVAAAIGFKPGEEAAEDEKPKYMTADDLRRLMQMTGGKIPGVE